MTFDLATYREHVARLDVSDLDFGAFRTQPLGPDVLACVRYMHDVEHHTSCYLRNLLNTRAHHDPEITSFLTLWNYEEHWHGEALGRVLAEHGEGAAARVSGMRRRLGWRIDASPLLWMAFSAANPHFLAVHMTFGVINEWTTQAGYARLRALAPHHPVLQELLRRIMRQEGRHIDFYLTQARARLEASAGARRTTRTAIKVLWNPVGAKVMPRRDTEHLVRTLFGGVDGEAVAARVDRRVDRLPGLDGMGLMAGALRQYGAGGSSSRAAMPFRLAATPG